MNVAAALAEAKARGVDRLDSQLLLARVLAQSRSWLLAHDDAVLDVAQIDVWRNWVTRRSSGEPLAYLFGEKEFHGLSLQVDGKVLVPRPETELLVDWALQLLRGALHDRERARVIDLGTGSGAIALALKHAFPDAEVVATDSSAAALAVAQANAQRLGLAVTFSLGSWWGAWATQPDSRFDLVLSNPPYIAAGDPHLEALRHEPATALTPGADGLAALREIIDAAPDHLAPGGWLLLEHGYDQADAVRSMLAASNFREIETRADLAGQPRCSGGRR